MPLLRIGLVALVAVPLAFAAGGRAAALPSRGCAAPVRGIQAPLPAPLTIRTSCGTFALARDGSVTRVSSDPSPVPANAGWWPSSGVWSRDEHGRVVIGRWHRVLWRSTDRLPLASALDTVVLGRHELAFSTGWRHSRLYVARLDGREHLVARDEFPIGWTSGGLYTGRVHDGAVFLRSATRAVRVPDASVRSAAFDRSTHSLLFVERNRLVQARGMTTRLVIGLAKFDLSSDQIQPQLLGRLVALQDRRRLVVLDPNGSLFASTLLPLRTRSDMFSGGPIASRHVGPVAFAVLHPDHRIETQVIERGVETVYLLRPGARAAVPIHSESMQFNVCGHGAGLSWHGDWLLYSTGEGPSALIDTSSGRIVELTALVRRLPGFSGVEEGGPLTVAWR